MAAADDVRNFETGETGDPNNPFQQGWFSRIRARKVLGDNVNKAPFVRMWGKIRTVASPMEQDKLTAVSDAVGFRRVNAVPSNVPNFPTVVDVGDMIVVWWEYFKLIADPATLKQAIENAKAFPNWPAGYTGAADFDKP